MKTKLQFTVLILVLVINVFSQDSTVTESDKTTKKEKTQIAKLQNENNKEENSKESVTKSKELANIKYRLLQDNGFLVDEAFSQEEDSLQHSFKFRRSFKGGGWESFIEEEIPLGSEKHQLSIGIPTKSSISDEFGKVKGFGDFQVSYRYQLLGGEYSRVSIAPTVSAILPTGSYRKELGGGGVGMEISLPVSIAINSRFMSHSNLGVTLTPRARNDEGDRAFTKNLEIGQSFVWLAHQKFNPLVEVVWERNQEVIGNKLTKKENEMFVSPGFRWGHTFKNGLTIVPGVAFPIGIGSSKGENGILFYLSFEHLFKKKNKEENED